MLKGESFVNWKSKLPLKTLENEEDRIRFFSGTSWFNLLSERWIIAHVRPLVSSVNNNQIINVIDRVRWSRSFMFGRRWQSRAEATIKVTILIALTRCKDVGLLCNELMHFSCRLLTSMTLWHATAISKLIHATSAS